MGLSKIAKRLRREATANPKKAAILGILFVVSLYFWIPMVSGWIKKKDSVPVTTPSPATTAAAKPFSPSTPTIPAKQVSNTSWKLIDRWIDNDPRMMTASHVSTSRDPFEFPKPEIAKTEPENEVITVKTTISPEEAGLTLTGTIIGPQGRIAQINGKNYVVGQNVQAKTEDTIVKTAFEVKEIRPQGVILQSGKERFELTLPKPGQSEKIELHYR